MYDLEALEELLRDARERYAEQGVLVRGDGQMSFQHIADVLAVCEAAGIQNVRLPVELRAETASAPTQN